MKFMSTGIALSPRRGWRAPFMLGGSFCRSQFSAKTPCTLFCHLAHAKVVSKRIMAVWACLALSLQNPISSVRFLSMVRIFSSSSYCAWTSELFAFTASSTSIKTVCPEELTSWIIPLTSLFLSQRTARSSFPPFSTGTFDWRTPLSRVSDV